MAVLNLRGIPETMHRRLRIRAAEHGRSMESEARAILEDSLRPARRGRGAAELPQWVAALYRGGRPRGVVADLIAERRREAKTE
jgi:plasmid stability protein